MWFARRIINDYKDQSQNIKQTWKSKATHNLFTTSKSQIPCSILFNSPTLVHHTRVNHTFSITHTETSWKTLSEKITTYIHEHIRYSNNKYTNELTCWWWSGNKQRTIEQPPNREHEKHKTLENNQKQHKIFTV